MVKKILVAVGDAESVEDTAKLAGILARTYGAEALVFHVWEWFFPTYRGGWASRETVDAARGLVNGVVKVLKQEGVRAGGRVISGPHGRTAKSIVAEAARVEADLIVMGSRGPSSWSALWSGSVAQWVIRHAPCPVAVARDAEERRTPVRQHRPAAAH